MTAPLGLQGLISPEQFQTFANIVLFMPPCAALAVLIPTWWWVLPALLVSSAVEVYQGRLGTRLTEVEDVAANTLGAAVGVGIGLLISRRKSRTHDAAASRSSPGDGATAPTTRGAAPPRWERGPGAGEGGRG